MQHDFDINNRRESGIVPSEIPETAGGAFTHVKVMHTGVVNVMARAVRYGRWHFVKALNPDVAGQAMYRQMLNKEFDIMTRLNHPAVAHVYGLETMPGMGTAIVMEWIDGTTLDIWLTQHPTKHDHRRMALLVLEGVAHVHSQGIAHRDLKPSNILVTRNGDQPKIVDFGLADTDTHATLKQTAGTPAYMDPEQYAQDGQADVRNDIYSLGIILSEMNLGSSWQRIVQRCMLPIDRRPQSAEELAEALRHAPQGQKRLLRAGIAALLAIAIGAGVIAGITASHQQRVNSRLQAANDSLRRQVEQLTAHQARQQSMATQQQRIIATLNDSLSATVNSQRAMQQEAAERRQRMQQALARGKAIIDQAWHRSGIFEHLDTLSNIRYLTSDNATLALKGIEAMNQYIDQLNSSFTDEERSSLREQLTHHNGQWYDRYAKKFHSIPLR